MISPSLTSAPSRPRLAPAANPGFLRRPTSDVISATPSPSPPPNVTSSTAEKSSSSSGKVTNFSIAAIMNNRRSAEENLHEADFKRRKVAGDGHAGEISLNIINLFCIIIIILLQQAIF